MSDKELDLFLAFVRNSERYVEFGSGGSTCIAAQHVRDSIISVDSSAEWIEKVRAACADRRTRPQLVDVDIGPTGDWGYPTDPTTQPKWPAYHGAPWTIDGGANGDLYMVDGRFRVACFAQTVLRCRDDAILCFHDFASRKHYHRVYDIAREIATAEDLSVFRPLPGRKDRASGIVQEYQFVPD